MPHTCCGESRADSGAPGTSDEVYRVTGFPTAEGSMQSVGQAVGSFDTGEPFRLRVPDAGSVLVVVQALSALPSTRRADAEVGKELWMDPLHHAAHAIFRRAVLKVSPYLPKVHAASCSQ